MEYHDTPRRHRKRSVSEMFMFTVIILALAGIVYGLVEKNSGTVPLPDKEGFYMSLKRHATQQGWTREVERAK